MGEGQCAPSLDQYVKFDAVSGDYYPIIYFNDYWNLQKDYYPINESLASLPLRVSFCPLSLWRWQLYAAQSTKSPWNFLGDELYEQSDEEQDSVKVALLETNPYLLALTIIVSIVHSVFEFLAFKNDIQFWNSRQSLEGLSVRSVFFGVFQSFVVLLYILDNETNFVVQVSVFIGVLIDLWKITKVMDVRLDREHRVAGIFPAYPSRTSPRISSPRPKCMTIWRSGTCPGSSSHSWAAMPSTVFYTWSTRAGTPGCSACSMASC